MRLRDRRLTAKPRITKGIRYWWVDRINPQTGAVECHGPITFPEAVAAAESWAKEASC